MFLLAFLDLTVHNIQWHSIVLILLTTTKFALINLFSHSIKQKTKDCALWGSLQHICSNVVFIFDVCRP